MSHDEKWSSHTDPRYNLTADQLAEVMKARKFIPADPPELYPTIRHWSNTPTSDFVCVRIVNGVREFLLTRRAERPWMGEWFVPGGRRAPGVHPVESCQQNFRRELGFVPDKSIIEFVGWVPLLNPEDQHGGGSYFTEMTIFQVTISVEQSDGIRLDATASEKRWFRAIEPEMPSTVQQIVRMCGFS